MPLPRPSLVFWRSKNNGTRDGKALKSLVNRLRRGPIDHQHGFREAPDYTAAFLWSFGFLLFFVLAVIYGLWGLLVVFAVAWGLNKGVDWIALRRAERERRRF